ncbi:MAG: hypothetical protein JWM80_2377 [Cyanobacteria bacterium RYN_339]|nr:hypothetical protein [Cyanobacteria bacterium RYN_339]
MMSDVAHEPSSTLPSSAPPEEFPLGPYLDTLYQWAEAQPWYQAEARAAWKAFLPPGTKDAPELPVPTDPDLHDRVLRFWSWFTLDRVVPDLGERPVDRFAKAHAKALTVEGKEAYEALGKTHFGAYRVHVKFRLASLEALVGGQKFALSSGPLTDELQAGDLVVGRIFPYQDGFLADPDVHIGHMQEAATDHAHALDAPAAEARYFNSLVPSKGGVMDVLDALLMQIDSPITADDVFDMVRESPSLDALLEELFAAPAYKLRYLHLRDRSLLDELMQELWDTSGPLQDADLTPPDATALARTVREALRAIAEGDSATLLKISDPKGFVPLYMDLFGMKGVQRLAGVQDGSPTTAIRTKHQLLPKDGGIFTTLSWGKDNDKHAAGMVAYSTADSRWLLSDISPPETAGPAMIMAFDRAQHLGWGDAPARDGVEALLRRAVNDVGYSVHDTIDLFRLWRDFSNAAKPDLAQPAIWAAGLELADSRYRNENLDVKVLSKSYGVMPRAIEDAAETIDETLRSLEKQEE